VEEEFCNQYFSVQLKSVGSLAQTPKGDGSGSIYADLILLPVRLRANFCISYLKGDIQNKDFRSINLTFYIKVVLATNLLKAEVMEKSTVNTSCLSSYIPTTCTQLLGYETPANNLTTQT